MGKPFNGGVAKAHEGPGLHGGGGSLEAHGLLGEQALGQGIQIGLGVGRIGRLECLEEGLPQGVRLRLLLAAGGQGEEEHSGQKAGKHGAHLGSPFSRPLWLRRANLVAEVKYTTCHRPAPVLSSPFQGKKRSRSRGFFFYETLSSCLP